MAHSQDVRYRPDIDGLRAIAVLAVVVFHAAPGWLPGGFVGVDVFFVISGYLISGIILRALAAGDFSTLDFYVRRVNRIFPALIVMLLVVAAYSWLMLLPDEFRRFGKHLSASALFALNLLQFGESSRYFGADTDPLMHLWSLGVEEQFYLLWPLLLLATWKLGKRQLFVILLAATASFAFNVVAANSRPLAAFYLPASRLWELAAGAALAHIQASSCWADRRLPSWLRLPNRDWQGLIGIALIAVACLGFNKNLSFPGWWALVPVSGALFIICAGPNSWSNRQLLSRPWIVFVGLISYPLYLWHWPVLSLLHIVQGGQVTAAMLVAAVVVAFALAWMTYQCVELPLRRSPEKSRIAAGSCAGMAACALAGLMVYGQTIPPRSASYPVVDPFVRAATEDWLPGTRDVIWTRVVDRLLTLGNAPRQVLFIGDSNVQQYYQRAAQFMADHPDNQLSAVFAVRGGCLPGSPEMSVVEADPEACRTLTQDAIAYARQPNVETVVIGACWYRYFVKFPSFTRFGEAGPIQPGTDAALENLRRLVTQLVAMDKRVYVILHIPIGHGFDPRYMIERSLLPPAFTVSARPPSRAEIERALQPFVARIRAIALESGAHVIDPMQWLCEADRCPAISASGEPMYHDVGHLSPSYAKQHVHFLDELLLSEPSS